MIQLIGALVVFVLILGGGLVFYTGSVLKSFYLGWLIPWTALKVSLSSTQQVSFIKALLDNIHDKIDLDIQGLEKMSGEQMGQFLISLRDQTAEKEGISKKFDFDFMALSKTDRESIRKNLIGLYVDLKNEVNFDDLYAHCKKDHYFHFKQLWQGWLNVFEENQMVRQLVIQRQMGLMIPLNIDAQLNVSVVADAVNEVVSQQLDNSSNLDQDQVDLKDTETDLDGGEVDGR